MAYIGVDISYGNIAVQEGVGDGSDVTPIATLNYTVPTSASIMVTLDGVTQVPGVGKDFTASGTTLTFSTAPANLVKILVYFLGRSLDIGTPADNTVTNAKMANNAIDSAELVAGSVDLAHLSATGTPSASLALKGDYSWGTAGGDSLGSGMIRTNGKTIAENITFAGTENGMTAGPVTINSGYTVTVTSGSTWTIV
jgi:hypothetical protein